MPDIKNEEELIKDPPIEESVSFKDDAPILIAAGIAEVRLKKDLEPAPIIEEPIPEEPNPASILQTIPAHHIQMAYEVLLKGHPVWHAAQMANIPEEVAQQIADEMGAVYDKLRNPIKK